MVVMGLVNLVGEASFSSSLKWKGYVDVACPGKLKRAP